MLSKDDKEMLGRLSAGDDHRYGEYYGEALHHPIYVKVSTGRATKRPQQAPTPPWDRA